MTIEPRREVPWPKGARCAVALTFDFDAEAAMLSLDPENARRLTVLSAATYGPDVGVPRILDMLDEFSLKATFFVPGYDAEKHPDVVGTIAAKGHEIAHHGYLHKRLDRLTHAEEREELTRGIEAIEKVCGKKPSGYRAPWWEMNPATPELLVQHGLVYDSSLMGKDSPYEIMTKKGPLVEIPVSFLLDDWEQFGYLTMPPAGYCIEDVGKVFRLWRDEFDALAQYNGCFVLTIHPWLSGRASRIVMLKQLIEHILKSGLAWIATAGDIALHTKEMQHGQGRIAVCA